MLTLLPLGWLPRDSTTQPVPSIAACLAGSARIAKMTSAEASMMAVALTLVSAMSSASSSVTRVHSDPGQAQNSSAGSAEPSYWVRS